MIRFNCTKCGQHYKTDDDLAGEEVECSKCDTTLQVPDDIIPPAQTKYCRVGKDTRSNDTLPQPARFHKGKKYGKNSKIVPPPLSLPKKTEKNYRKNS